MSSSSINSQLFQAKAGSIQNQADSSSIYSSGQWSFKNSTAVASVTITDAGNVGIGTASPWSQLSVNTAGGATAGYIGIKDSVQGGDIRFGKASGVNNSGILGTWANNDFLFYTNSAERMRIAASGDVLIGTTSALAGGQAPGLDVLNASGASTQIRFRNSGAAAGRFWRIGSDTAGTAYFINDVSAGVYIAYGNTGWTGLSDERHKTDLKAIENAAAKVASLRAVTGRYKTDEEGKSRAFLIAQDVEKVLPEAVDTSNEERWGITYTDTIPLLVAAIQEQQAQIEALRAEVAALKAP